MTGGRASSGCWTNDDGRPRLGHRREAGPPAGEKGFDDFLRPVPFTRLRQVATDGPVVVVNVSPHGSHALIVTSADVNPDPAGGMQVVDLPAATWDTVIDQANTLLAARHRATDPTLDCQQREDDRHAVFDVLAWTWQAITEPVLTALGHTTTPTGPVEDWPRVWWCPTGPATVLPLHARAPSPHPHPVHRHGRGCRDRRQRRRTGRLLLHPHPDRPDPDPTRPAPQPAQVLAVGVPDAPGLPPLPAVRDELQVLADALPARTRLTTLIAGAATCQAVLDAMPATRGCTCPATASSTPPTPPAARSSCTTSH